MKRHICLYICLAGTLPAVVLAAELPVRQVVLYKHGVGYFERAGELGPGESARLEFKASEMDDVLKSLTVEEQGGGKISGLRYDSSQPLAAKLADFPFHLGNGQPVSTVLDQLKGAAIELKFANETVTGGIVAARLVAGDEKRAEREQITLLLDSGDLRNFDLGAASSIRFTDPRLQAQFKDYLAALTAARSNETRSIYIDSTDARRRQVRAGYMTPTPIWKSSYRLIFGEAAQPTLEGWAIVDNTTSEDWTKVNLSLVSGRPISFISALYEPRYVARQKAELPDEAAAVPVVYEGAISNALQQVEIVPSMAGPAAPPPAAPAAAAGMAVADQLSRKEIVSSLNAVPMPAREVGELFEYHIPTPVTVRRNESAMLPFLQQTIDARKLLIYSDRSSTHPTNAVEIANATGKTLDGGPITVYDGGAYAGEALMETVKTGDKRLISYAVDLGTRITTQFDSRSDVVREIHARRGVLTTRNAGVETQTYTIHNVDQKAKTLIIEHPARPEYNLLDRKPSERTSKAYRFEVKLAAGATEKFPITEERVYESTYVAGDLAPDVLFSYARSKVLSDAGRKQLEHMADLKRRSAAAGLEIVRLDQEVKDIVRDQERLRQNIGSLNQVSGQQQQVQTYAQKLAGQETQLAALRDRRADLERQRAALETETAAAIESLTF